MGTFVVLVFLIAVILFICAWRWGPDADRLDWIEQHRAEVDTTASPFERFAIYLPHDGVPRSGVARAYGRTLRDAIDVAMAQSKEAK